MIEVFQRRTPEHINDLEKALAIDQMEIITRKAHSLLAQWGIFSFLLAISW